MQRIILLLFIIPLFFFLFFGLGLLIDSGFNKSTNVYLISYIITLIIVVWSYSQLWRIRYGLPSRFSQATLWIIMIISILIAPITFYTNTYIQQERNIAEKQLYEQTHCKEVITKKHKYVVKICDNERIIGDQVSVSEYIRESAK